MLITFGRVNIKWLLFIAFPIASLFHKYINYKIKVNVNDNNKDNTQNEKINNFFFEYFIYFLTTFISSIILISLRFITERKKKKKNEISPLLNNKSKNVIKNIENLSEKERFFIKQEKDKKTIKYQKIKSLILSAFFFFFSQILNLYLQVTDGYINRGSFLITFSYLLRIISLGIFSHFFIKFINILFYQFLNVLNLKKN